MLSSGEGELLATESTAGCLIRIICKKKGAGEESSLQQKASLLEKRLAPGFTQESTKKAQGMFPELEVFFLGSMKCLGKKIFLLLSYVLSEAAKECVGMSFFLNHFLLETVLLYSPS